MKYTLKESEKTIRRVYEVSDVPPMMKPHAKTAEIHPNEVILTWANDQLVAVSVEGRRMLKTGSYGQRAKIHIWSWIERPDWLVELIAEATLEVVGVVA